MLRIAIAVLLWVAAWFKATNVVEILASDGMLSHRSLLLFAIWFESAFGLYMLIGKSSWAWLLSLVVFVSFSLVSAYAILSGVGCNCFAKSIPPWLVLPIDLSVLGLLIWLRPSIALDRLPSIFVTVACLALGVVVVGFTVRSESRPQATDPLHFLLADTLQGQPWPIGAHFHDQLRALGAGKWLVLVLRKDCEHCRELVENYFSDPTLHRAGERTATFIAGDRQWGFELDEVTFSPTRFFSWSHEEPFCASPAVFVLQDGSIVDAADGKEGASKVRKLLHSE